MADEPKPNGSEPVVYSDVPASSALVRTSDEARSMALKIAGEEIPSECRFHCITCGWSKTLQFEDDEIAALDNDVSSYSGPCPDCSCMTLVPYKKLMGQDVQTVFERAKQNRTEEYQEQAEVLVDTIEKRVASVMAGGSLRPTPEEDVPPASEIHDPRPPGQREDLPDLDDVDASKLTPR